jgi:hypothetical protein
MQIQGQVGAPVTSYGVGSLPNLRAGQQADLIVSQLHGKNYETNYRLNMFSFITNGLTQTNAMTTATSAGTAAPIIGLYNPAGSGKNISLMRMTQAYTSGTPTGPLLWNTFASPSSISAVPFTSNTNVIGATVSTVSNNAAGSVARIFNNQTLTGQSVAGAAFRTAGGPTSAASVAGQIQTFTEDFQGDLIVAPGSMIGLCTYANGTSAVFSIYLTWEELPV